jgi:iron complex outermembrane receptor protein
MTKLTLISSALFSVLCSQSALAATVNGKVTDDKNQPISNATIHVHGKSQSVKSNKLGEFTIDIDAKSQLHITKENYSDSRIDVNDSANDVTVTLKPTSVETVVVYASALHKNSLEMISPVSVLSGDDLKNKSKPTLGETLKGLPGVNASYFGPVSSSPIIRGLGGPRVKITQNGLDSSDASRIGPDHATSSDSLAAEQIEVLRGPSTLLYGSGAIGGVVNVVDNRIPTSNINELAGAAEYSHDTVSNANTYAAKLESGYNNFNFHFDGTKRKGHDYQTPTFIISDEDGDVVIENSVENTFIDSETVNFGTSYVSDHLTIGFSYGNIKTDYGIPGDEHHHGHDHEEAEEQISIDAIEPEIPVYAHLEQDRWQGLLSYALHNNWIESVNLRVGYTDYAHSEIENGEIGTTFTNTTTEARLNVEHKFANWHGMVGYHYSDSDYDAIGEEAFTPASITTTHALYLLEEREIGEVTVELGARIEDYNIQSDISTNQHSHAAESVGNKETIGYNEDFTNVSLSAGAIWQYMPGNSIAMSLSHSERAPLSAELLSNGLHIATGTYELGLGYNIEDDEAHFEPENIKQETSTNLDLSFRRFNGDFGYTVNFFYNDIKNFYFQENTGLVFDEVDGLESADEAHSDAIAVYQFTRKDVELYGFEFDVHYQINSNAMVKVFGDSTRAKLKNNEGNLPRIPANKLGSELLYDLGRLQLTLTGTHYFDQNDISIFETKTDGYTLFDAQVNYQLDLGPIDTQLYLNVDNISDELGFVHTSFIKDTAPLPGRNFRFGIRGYF